MAASRGISMSREEQAVAREIADYLSSQVPAKTSTRVGPITFKPCDSGENYVTALVQHVRTNAPVIEGEEGIFIIEEHAYEICIRALRVHRPKPPLK